MLLPRLALVPVLVAVPVAVALPVADLAAGPHASSGHAYRGCILFWNGRSSNSLSPANIVTAALQAANLSPSTEASQRRWKIERSSEISCLNPQF